MNTITTEPDSLQTDLLAQLPANGQPVTVRALAESAGVSDYRVTSALFDPYLAHQVDYDIRRDAYSLPLPPPFSPQR